MKGIIKLFHGYQEKLRELGKKQWEKLQKDQKQPRREDEILLEIEMVCRQIEHTQTCFQMTSDEDLLDSCIYEMESLNARYRYLLKQAKESGISRQPFLPRVLNLNCE